MRNGLYREWKKIQSTKKTVESDIFNYKLIFGVFLAKV